MGELLEFTGRKDFEFLKFGNVRGLTQDDIKSFKEDCIRVNSTHNQMVIEQCKLGLQLLELKESNVWKNVINPESGFAFMVHSFEEFCKYAFHFSKTKTYDLMQISKFVTTNSEDEVFFIDEKYAKFSTSHLKELASVPSGQRHYFTPDMTIEQVRMVKKYIATNEFWYDKQKEDFDLLTYASQFVEGKKKPKELPGANSSEVMDGQLSLFSEDNEEENEDGAGEIFPILGKTDDQSEAIEWEFIPERDEYDEADEAQEDMRADMQTIEEAAEMSFVSTVETEESPLPRYDLSKRKEIREFLHGYKTWIRRWDIYGLLTVYVCRFRNGMRLYAVENKRLLEMEGGEPSTVVRYYWKTEQGATAYEVSTNILWEYIAAHNEEL